MRKTLHRFGWMSLSIIGLAATLSLRAYQQPVSVFAEETTPAVPAGCSVYQGSFLDLSAEAMLHRLGVVFYKEDKVTAFPDPALGIGAKVTVCSAPVVTIIDAGTTQNVRSWAATVEDLADEQRLMLADKDEVSPKRAESIANGRVITVTRVAEAEVSVKVKLDYTTQYKDDPTMEKGQQKVSQKGEAGQRVDTYLERRENGKVVSRKKTASEVTKQVVPEIILKGTKIVELDRGGASWYGGVASMTAAHKTLPKGSVVRVTNMANGKSVVVTIADRGPYVNGRVIDLSKDAFAAIASIGSGVISDVKITKE